MKLSVSSALLYASVFSVLFYASSIGSVVAHASSSSPSPSPTVQDDLPLNLVWVMVDGQNTNSSPLLLNLTLDSHHLEFHLPSSSNTIVNLGQHPIDVTVPLVAFDTNNSQVLTLWKATVSSHLSWSQALISKTVWARSLFSHSNPFFQKQTTASNPSWTLSLSRGSVSFLILKMASFSTSSSRDKLSSSSLLEASLLLLPSNVPPSSVDNNQVISQDNLTFTYNNQFPTIQLFVRHASGIYERVARSSWPPSSLHRWIPSFKLVPVSTAWIPSRFHGNLSTTTTTNVGTGCHRLWKPVHAKLFSFSSSFTDSTVSRLAAIKPFSANAFQCLSKLFRSLLESIATQWKEADGPKQTFMALFVIVQVVGLIYIVKGWLDKLFGRQPEYRNRRTMILARRAAVVAAGGKPPFTGKHGAIPLSHQRPLYMRQEKPLLPPRPGPGHPVFDNLEPAPQTQVATNGSGDIILPSWNEKGPTPLMVVVEDSERETMEEQLAAAQQYVSPSMVGAWQDSFNEQGFAAAYRSSPEKAWSSSSFDLAGESSGSLRYRERRELPPTLPVSDHHVYQPRRQHRPHSLTALFNSNRCSDESNRPLSLTATEDNAATCLDLPSQSRQQQQQLESDWQHLCLEEGMM